MKPYILLAALTAAAMAGACSDNAYDPGEPAPARPASDYAVDKDVAIDATRTYQTIAGFGASDCWMCQWVGRDWTASRSRIAELLFSQEVSEGQPKGIGLSMWRVNAGAGSAEKGDASGVTTVHRRAESFMGDNGQYDWTKCEGQRYFMEQAKAMGTEKFVLFSNSPLVQWTYNGQGRSDRGNNSNLLNSRYDDFADYLADIVDHFKKEGYNFSHISPINEPQGTWNGHDQEGTGWTLEQSAKLARELDRALTERSLDTDILLAECDRWLYFTDQDTWQWSGADMADSYWNPSSSAYIGDLKHFKPLIGAHSYWTDTSWDEMRTVRASVARKAAQYGAEVWQTEWCMLGDEHSRDEYSGHGTASDLERALYMTRIIHNDMTVANCSSWSYWVALDQRLQHGDRWLLVYLDMVGGTNGSVFDGEGSFAPAHTLWALGNYSLFVRPGFRRVDLSTAENRNFFGSAYLSPDGKRLVAVYTNYSEKPVRINVALNGLATAPASVRSYTTSADKSLEEAAIDTAAEILLDPQSVTTFVYDL